MSDRAQSSNSGAGLTVGATEGPYYISNTAELRDGNLNAADLPGQPIKVSGHVYEGTGTSRPLPGAKIEIWQADNAGSYHPNSSGDANQIKPDRLALRGYVRTDATGHYEFGSVYPGQYGGRARHIHIRVSAAGHDALITQLVVPAKAGDQAAPRLIPSRGLCLRPICCSSRTTRGSRRPRLTFIFRSPRNCRPEKTESAHPHETSSGKRAQNSEELGHP